MHKIEYHSTSVPGIETMAATTDRSFPRHTHDQYGIGLMERGGHRSCTGRRTVVASPGHLIFVNPGEVHDGHSLRREDRSWRMIYFDSPFLNALRGELSERDLPHFEFTEAAFTDKPLRENLVKAFSVLSSDDVGNVLRDSLLLSIVGRLHSLCAAEPRTAEHNVPDIRRAIELIHADPGSEDLTLQRLASEVGVSRYQLIRAFARQLCLTPHSYIVQQRLSRARALMRTGAGLAEIVYRTGFTDQSHFTKTFARQFGISPGKYLSSLR